MNGTFTTVPQEIVHEIEVAGKLDRLLVGETVPFPGLCTVVQYFQASLEAKRIQGNDIALYFEDNSITFQQLDQLSSKLAQVLREELSLSPDIANKNPDGDILFGVCGPPSEKLVILLFAILKLGAAYLPFDISFPENRVLKIVSISKPLLIISDAHPTILCKFDGVRSNVKVITMDDIFGKLESRPDSTSTVVTPLEGNSNLYERTGIVLFTSGSSGEPKGVRINHRSFMSRLSWEWEQFPFQCNERCCWKASLTFVVSIFEIFGPLLQGKPVVVFSRTLVANTHLFVQKVQTYKITRLIIVTSFLQSILTLLEIQKEENSKNNKINEFSSIKLLLCGAEAVGHKILSRFFKLFPEGVTICSVYGSTEMGSFSCEAFECIEDVEGKCLGDYGAHVSIGQPVINTLVYILGPDKQLTPQGQVGEICVAGESLLKGYLGSPTSDKFITNPFCKTTGFNRLFYTGDFGRIRIMKTGGRALFYDGRVDSQIKVRGHRIDLTEIDAIISGLSLIRKAVVLCYRPGHQDQQIVAFVVPQNKDEGTAKRIRLVLKTKLLPYQMPKVKVMEELPLLVNGKVDRQRLLLDYGEEKTHDNDFEDWQKLDIPRDSASLFKIVIKTISQVTGTSIRDIAQDLDDSFYEIGGTSLNTLTVIAELKKNNYFISIEHFVTAKSIRHLCQAVVYNPDGKMDFRLELAEDARKTWMPELLNDTHKNEAIDIIATSFVTKGDLETLVGVVHAEFVTYVESMWSSLVEKGYSFIVRRGSDKKIVGVCFIFDAYDVPAAYEEFPEESSGLKIISDFLNHYEDPVRKKLPEGQGKILHGILMGTHQDLTDAENVVVTKFMNEEQVRLGKRHNFLGTFGTSTSPLTQQIAKDDTNCTIMMECQINQYVSADGKKPFEMAPDSQKVLVCWTISDSNGNVNDE